MYDASSLCALNTHHMFFENDIRERDCVSVGQYFQFYFWNILCETVSAFID